jgi:hypothetical protein
MKYNPSRGELQQWILEQDERMERYVSCERWPALLIDLEGAYEDVQDEMGTYYTPLDVAISMLSALVRCKPSPKAISEALSFIRENRLVPTELEKDMVVLEQWSATWKG